MLQSWDLNVEDMSREALIKNYFNAVHMVEELSEASDERVNRLRGLFKIRPAVAVVLSLLLTGRHFRKEAIMTVLGHHEKSDFKVVTVYICNLRKIFVGTDITINTLSHSGYVMPRKSIDIIENMIVNDEKINPPAAPLKPVVKWSKGDDAWLLENYKASEVEKIAAKLKRSAGAVQTRASLLKQNSIRPQRASQ